MKSEDIFFDMNCFPVSIDGKNITFLELVDFKKTVSASRFLHLSALIGGTGRRVEVPIVEFLDVASRLDASSFPRRHLFHLGNVGSSLCAMLFQEVFGAFVMREPGILRQLALTALRAEAKSDVRTRRVVDTIFFAILKRWGSFQPDVVIKHTSLSTIFSSSVQNNISDVRTIFVGTSLKNYVCHASASEAAGHNVRLNSAEFSDLLGSRFNGNANGESLNATLFAAAAKWLVVSSHAIERFEGRVVDFDNLGSDRESLLEELGWLVGASVGAGEARGADHALWGINVKTSEAHSFAQRRAGIDLAYAENRQEIDKVCAWARRTWLGSPRASRPGFERLLRDLEGSFA